MSASLVLLANGTASNEVVDKHGEARPPKVPFNNGLGAKTPEVARKGRGMDGVKER